jgi:hypothetical protein
VIVLVTGGTATERWRYIGHLLACRSGHRCEGCGRPIVAGVREPSIHHRQARGMGGTSRADIHDLSNLLLLCAGFSRRLAGVLGCHGDAEHHRSDPVARGLIVPHPTDPATVPIVLASGRRVLLDPYGPHYLTPREGPTWV